MRGQLRQDFQCSMDARLGPTVQHNVSHCGAPSWRRVQAHPNSSSEKGKQNGHITCLKHINLGGTWWCCWKVDSATFHAGFCLGVGEHDATTAKFCRNANACFLNVSIAALDSIRPCAAKSETTRLDGWQGSKGLPPSMKCDVSVRATQQLKSRTQANGWQTNRPIPRHGCILLHWVFQRPG